MPTPLQWLLAATMVGVTPSSFILTAQATNTAGQGMRNFLEACAVTLWSPPSATFDLTMSPNENATNDEHRDGSTGHYSRAGACLFLLARSQYWRELYLGRVRWLRFALPSANPRWRPYG